MTQRAFAASIGRKGWRIFAVALGVCAALSAGAWFLGVEPAVARRDAQAADVAELATREQKAKALATSLATVRRQLADTTHAVDALPLRLEPASAVNHRLARLADLAGETGLAVDEMQPAPAVDGTHYQTVPIRISGTGTYPTCAKFLHQLRRQFPDTAVKSFECNNPTPTKDAPAAAFRVELAWYTAPARK